MIVTICYTSSTLDLITWYKELKWIPILNRFWLIVSIVCQNFIISFAFLVSGYEIHCSKGTKIILIELTFRYMNLKIWSQLQNSNLEMNHIVFGMDLKRGLWLLLLYLVLIWILFYSIGPCSPVRVTCMHGGMLFINWIISCFLPWPLMSFFYL